MIGNQLLPSSNWSASYFWPMSSFLSNANSSDFLWWCFVLCCFLCRWLEVLLSLWDVCWVSYGIALLLWWFLATLLTDLLLLCLLWALTTFWAAFSASDLWWKSKLGDQLESKARQARYTEPDFRAWVFIRTIWGCTDLWRAHTEGKTGVRVRKLGYSQYRFTKPGANGAWRPS